MTLVKLYSTDTGSVETVNAIDFPDNNWERAMAKAMVDFLVSQDHSTDHVYYVSEVS
jgi:hypothetical protein